MSNDNATQILVLIDTECDMAKVKIGDETVMVGNFWDFHPGCHGITEYGDFNSPLSLAFAVKRKTPGKSQIMRQHARYDEIRGGWLPVGEPTIVR